MVPINVYLGKRCVRDACFRGAGGKNSVDVVGLSSRARCPWEAVVVVSECGGRRERRDVLLRHQQPPERPYTSSFQTPLNHSLTTLLLFASAWQGAADFVLEQPTAGPGGEQVLHFSAPYSVTATNRLFAVPLPEP